MAGQAQTKRGFGRQEDGGLPAPSRPPRPAPAFPGQTPGGGPNRRQPPAPQPGFRPGVQQSETDASQGGFPPGKGVRGRGPWLNRGIRFPTAPVRLQVQNQAGPAAGLQNTVDFGQHAAWVEAPGRSAQRGHEMKGGSFKRQFRQGTDEDHGSRGAFLGHGRRGRRKFQARGRQGNFRGAAQHAPGKAPQVQEGLPRDRAQPLQNALPGPAGGTVFPGPAVRAGISLTQGIFKPPHRSHVLPTPVIWSRPSQG
jgi:hypothetical protein